MKTGIMLMDTGNAFLKYSKFLSRVLLVSICALPITVACCNKYALSYLALSGPYSIVNYLFGTIYLLIGLGTFSIPLYFNGLIILGLGQISINTAQHKSEPHAPVTTQTQTDTPLRTNKSYISPMLVKIIQSALNMDNDAIITQHLRDSMNRLPKESEKKIIQLIINSPDGELRSMLLKVYEEITDSPQTNEIHK